MGTPWKPPTLACWLLAKAVPSRYRDQQLGDLEEVFGERARVRVAR